MLNKFSSNFFDILKHFLFNYEIMPIEIQSLLIKIFFLNLKRIPIPSDPVHFLYLETRKEDAR